MCTLQATSVTGEHLKDSLCSLFCALQLSERCKFNLGLYSWVLQPGLLLPEKKQPVLQSNTAHAQDLLLQEIPSLFSTPQLGDEQTSALSPGCLEADSNGTGAQIPEGYQSCCTRAGQTVLYLPLLITGCRCNDNTEKGGHKGVFLWDS